MKYRNTVSHTLLIAVALLGWQACGNGTPADAADTAVPAETPVNRTVVLNNGQRWEANPETTKAIHDMTNRVRPAAIEPGVPDIESLKTALRDDFKSLVENCTMTGEAHDQLHNYILPLRDRIERLSPATSRDTIANLLAYLESYHFFFR